MRKQLASREQAVRVDDVISRTEEQLRQRKAQYAALERKYKAQMQQLEQLHNVVNASPYSFLDENDYSQMVGDFYVDLLEGLSRYKSEEYEKAQLELEHIEREGRSTDAENSNNELRYLKQQIEGYASEIATIEQQIEQMLDREVSVECASYELLSELAEEMAQRHTKQFAELSIISHHLDVDDKARDIQSLHDQINNIYVQLEFYKAKRRRNTLEARDVSVLTTGMRKTVLGISIQKLEDQLELYPLGKSTHEVQAYYLDDLPEDQVYWVQLYFEAAKADLYRRGIDIQDV